MILLHFPKAQIMSSHAIRNNLWLIYFFQARRRHWPWGPLESPMGELLWQIKKTTQALETWAGLQLRLFLGLKNITTLKHGLSIVRTFNRVINHVPPLLPLGRPQLLIHCCSSYTEWCFLLHYTTYSKIMYKKISCYFNWKIISLKVTKYKIQSFGFFHQKLW